MADTPTPDTRRDRSLGTLRSATEPAAFGRYTILAPIGGGAMGLVYKAHDPAIDRIVAVKVVRADLLDPGARDEYLERFRIEVRSAGRCQHPAIIAVHDFGEHDGAPYLVMEHVDGQTLAAVLKESRQDRRSIAPLLATAMLQVLEGLSLAHGHGIIHRDIKPSNILITAEGRAKIADFGIARLDITAMTVAGGMVGTPSYMAPEQALGRQVDARADLFSVGAILYEILLGRPPFAAASMPETLVRLTGPDPADLGPLMQTPLGAVLARGLQKDPEQRFGSAAAFAEALRQAMRGRPVDEATLLISPALPGVARGTATSGSGSSTVFDSTLLQRLREDLARHIGPIAETLLRRATANAQSEDDLVHACSQMIENPAERTAFIRRHRAAATGIAASSMASGATSLGGGRSLGFALNPAQEARTIEALARYVGPIARVLLRRSLPVCTSASDLVDRLVGEISDAAEAEQCRRHLRAALTDD